MTCGAKLRPFPDDTEVECESKEPEPHTEHHAALRDYAFPGSLTTLTWFDVDRRTFRGEWAECSHYWCPLPAGHQGGCLP